MDRSNKKPLSQAVFFAALWIIAFVVCLLVIKKSTPDRTTGIIISGIPALTFGLFIFSLIKAVASMDEVQIRIQMEAVVIAFSLGLLTLMTLGLLDLVIMLNKENWSYRHLVPYFAVFYFIGLLISKRKYD